ncbi:hypothetical protein I6A84_19525 [Frankia sp. CNm7]|uniref:Uncharacterized protein n=1 Tax=Frankia nepalensis TaxID=1836974 RepID=A0A937REU7_9ACTN|nr:hypothetical protein [Frankia nepalensis]MBL7496586.1 hypothetical protein [Frankia nepalensis]MBL7508805.1 hypothetical protein [Frankia nepalensis]MBL7520219.1 hypothetical protein [Frankia nepalensis]MBL7627559.1 hypothetical protein [Frankia nepalensis]
MSAAATRPAATRFTLRVPDSWFEFDVWRATRTGDLARLVDARTAKYPRLRPYRAALLKLLREVAERAERQGAVYCATATADESGAGDLLATLLVFHTHGGDDPAENTVAAIAARVSAVAPGQPGEPWRSVEIVTIPAGEAVRIRGVERGVIGGAGAAATIDTVTTQTLVPVPGGEHGAEGVLNVVLTSPHLGLVDELFDLFEAISDTLAWTPDVPAS